MDLFSSPADLEALAARLEASGSYRVLRKVQRRAPVSPTDHPGSKLGLFLDLETTGLDPCVDEVIEIALVQFVYSPEGQLLGVGEVFQSFREPSCPIPAEVTALTGIDHTMIEGAAIDMDALRTFVARAGLIVAHNAAFDRCFAERLCDMFSTKAWACSMSEPPWSDEGYEGRALPYLCAQAGFFYDRHRAVHDCLAGIELLGRPLPRSARPALAALLDYARRPTWRVWAENTPFELKDALKGRGYRWNAGDDGRPRAWFVDVAPEQLKPELSYLNAEVYGCEVELLRTRLTAWDRYSERC